jgi:hypothetical protein
MEGWIKTESFADRNVRNFCIDMRELRNAFPDDIHAWRGTDDFPFKVERFIKDKKVVPENAYLVAWFLEHYRLVFVLRFMHRDFPEVKPGNMIDNEDVDLLKLNNKSVK